MKYIYTGGQYAEFRGYVFKYGQPTTIMDKGTEEAIARRPDFRVAEEASEKVKEQVTTSAEVDDSACPKCGKSITRGRYMHVKFCRGKA